MRKVRVLHVINDLSSGGAEKIVRDLCLNPHQYDAGVLLLRKGKSVYVEELINNSIPVVWLSRNSLYSFLFAFRIHKAIARFKADVIHVHLFPSFYYIGLLAKLFKYKLVLIFHEHNTKNSRMKMAILRSVEKYVYSAFDHVICISPAVKNVLESYLGSQHTANLRVIPNGISLEKYSPTTLLDRAYVDRKFDEPFRKIVMVARFNKQKDHMTVINALKLLEDKFELYFIGEGETENEVKDYVAISKLSNRVHFLGYQSKVWDLLPSFHYFVLSSFWEGFGLAAVEAMSAGLPVIGTNVPGLRDVLKDAGMLFGVQNSAELVSCIKRLDESPDQYLKCISACRNRAQAYSLEAMNGLLEKLYNESLS